MKRKYIIIFVGVLLVLGGVWAFWPGYGSGYSERQRQLWNERRELFPRDILFDSVTMQYSYGLELAEGLENGKGNDILRGIKRQEDSIIQELLENRDKEALAWNVKVPERPDLTKLPLEGLARSELVARAESGDGDACLMLAWQQLSSFQTRFGIAGLSWSAQHEVERWLGKAVELKRPGAEFLLQYAGEMKEHLVKNRGVRKRGQGKELNPGNNPSYISIPGYRDFLQALEQGDSLPFLVAEAILPELETLSEKKILYDVLLEQAKKGDAAAQRRMAQVYFHRRFWHIGDGLRDRWDQMRQNEALWKNRLDWLSATQSETVVKSMERYGWLGVNDTQIWKDNDEACRFARQAGRQGDLTGMYLWLRYGVSSLGSISRADWEEMFSFARVLMEAGYAPYLEEFDRLVFYTDSRGRFCFQDNSLHHSILGSFYSGEYFKEVREGIFKGSTLRQGRLWQWGWSESLENVKELERMGYWDEMWNNCQFMLTRTDKDAGKYYLSLMESKAAEGDLLAMYYLADVYEKGVFVPADIGRASRLLRQILLTEEEYPFVQLFYADKYKQASIDLTDAVRLRLLDMTLKYSSFPGRDEKKAFEWACWVEAGKKFSGNYQDGLYCYLLGQVYERGIGTVPDKEKALEYYGVSANVDTERVHQGCQAAWSRLSAELETSPGKDESPEQDGSF